MENLLCSFCVISLVWKYDVELRNIYSFFPQTSVANDMMGGQGGDACKGRVLTIVMDIMSFKMLGETLS